MTRPRIPVTRTPMREPEPEVTARDLAAALYNAVDGEGDIPFSLFARELAAHGIVFEPCADCGRVEGDHAPYCPSGERCPVCGGNSCPDDHYEPGEIA